MSRSARVFLALLLALLVPWQAVSAATIIVLPAPVSHEHRASTSMHHGAGHAAHHAVAGSSTKAQCGAGASCCIAVAPPSSHAVFDIATFSQHYTLANSAGLAAFLTAGLDRPPRTDLA